MRHVVVVWHGGHYAGRVEFSSELDAYSALQVVRLSGGQPADCKAVAYVLPSEKTEFLHERGAAAEDVLYQLGCEGFTT